MGLPYIRFVLIYRRTRCDNDTHICDGQLLRAGCMTGHHLEQVAAGGSPTTATSRSTSSLANRRPAAQLTRLPLADESTAAQTERTPWPDPEVGPPGCWGPLPRMAVGGSSRCRGEDTRPSRSCASCGRWGGCWARARPWHAPPTEYAEQWRRANQPQPSWSAVARIGSAPRSAQHQGLASSDGSRWVDEPVGDSCNRLRSRWTNQRGPVNVMRSRSSPMGPSSSPTTGSPSNPDIARVDHGRGHTLL